MPDTDVELTTANLAQSQKPARLPAARASSEIRLPTSLSQIQTKEELIELLNIPYAVHTSNNRGWLLEVLVESHLADKYSENKIEQFEKLTNPAAIMQFLRTNIDRSTEDGAVLLDRIDSLQRKLSPNSAENREFKEIFQTAKENFELSEFKYPVSQLMAILAEPEPEKNQLIALLKNKELVQPILANIKNHLRDLPGKHALSSSLADILKSVNDPEQLDTLSSPTALKLASRLLELNDYSYQKRFESSRNRNNFYFLDIARGLLSEGESWKDVENNPQRKSEIENKFSSLLPIITAVRNSTGVELLLEYDLKDFVNLCEANPNVRRCFESEQILKALSICNRAGAFDHVHTENRKLGGLLRSQTPAGVIQKVTADLTDTLDTRNDLSGDFTAFLNLSPATLKLLGTGIAKTILQYDNGSVASTFKKMKEEKFGEFLGTVAKNFPGEFNNYEDSPDIITKLYLLHSTLSSGFFEEYTKRTASFNFNLDKAFFYAPNSINLFRTILSTKDQLKLSNLNEMFLDDLQKTTPSQLEVKFGKPFGEWSQDEMDEFKQMTKAPDYNKQNDRFRLQGFVNEVAAAVASNEGSRLYSLIYAISPKAHLDLADFYKEIKYAQKQPQKGGISESEQPDWWNISENDLNSFVTDFKAAVDSLPKGKEEGSLEGFLYNFPLMYEKKTSLRDPDFEKYLRLYNSEYGDGGSSNLRFSETSPVTTTVKFISELTLDLKEFVNSHQRIKQIGLSEQDAFKILWECQNGITEVKIATLQQKFNELSQTNKISHGKVSRSGIKELIKCLSE